jgi:hypothetical protein
VGGEGIRIVEKDKLSAIPHKEQSYSNFEKRGNLKGEKANMRGVSYLRSDSFYRQNVQRLARLSCKKELYACFFRPAYRNSNVVDLVKLKEYIFFTR